MTSKYESTVAPVEEAAGRLKKAVAFAKMAREGSWILGDEKMALDPAVDAAIMAAIAFADAVTIVAKQRKNKGNHATATVALRDAVGPELPKSVETALAALLGRKDEVEYRSKIMLTAVLEQSLTQMERIEKWALEWLAKRGHFP